MEVFLKYLYNLVVLFLDIKKYFLYFIKEMKLVYKGIYKGMFVVRFLQKLKCEISVYVLYFMNGYGVLFIYREK